MWFIVSFVSHCVTFSFFMFVTIFNLQISGETMQQQKCRHCCFGLCYIATMLVLLVIYITGLVWRFNAYGR